ncbi:hypothetical protein PoMZ_12055, partial [Pyricularia oryzae]
MYSGKPAQLRRQPKCYRSPVSEIKHRELAFACGRLVAFPAKLRLPSQKRPSVRTFPRQGQKLGGQAHGGV